MLLNARSCTALVGALLVVLERETESSDNLTKPVMALKLNAKSKSKFQLRLTAANAVDAGTENLEIANIPPPSAVGVPLSVGVPVVVPDDVQVIFPGVPVNVPEAEPKKVANNFSTLNSTRRRRADVKVYLRGRGSTPPAFRLSEVQEMKTASSVVITLQPHAVIYVKKGFLVRTRSAVYNRHEVRGTIKKIQKYFDEFAAKYEIEVTVESTTSGEGDKIVKMSEVEKVVARGVDTPVVPHWVNLP